MNSFLRALGFAGTAVSMAMGLAWAQTGTGGTISVTVQDASGAAVPEAALEIRNYETNDTYRGSTNSSGEFAFQNLQFGSYRLQVTKTGFNQAVFATVAVQTGRTTDVPVQLTVGNTTSAVTISGEAPVIDTTSSTLSDTIDTKQVVNLPVSGRNVMSFAFLVPGWANTGVASSSGTWNNMPGGAVVGADFDGTPGISNRFRSGGFNYGTTSVQPRIEDVGEMTISTGQLDLSGTGTSAMRIAVVTRHGTNQFHGRVFEDFRNTDLNANSWSNNAVGLARNIIKLNDFGVSVGGPILKNKLFFFGTYAESIQPGSSTATANVLSSSAQQGIFSYKNSSGSVQQVNLFQIAQNAGFAASVNPVMGGQLSKIDGVLSQGSLTATSDPNINVLSFLYTSRTTTYYPTIRVDYNLSDRIRLYASYAQTKTNNYHTNAPQFPGGIDPLDYVSGKGNNRIAGFGFDWIIKPTLMNQFHAGYMYQLSQFDVENLGIDLPNIFETQWGYGQTSLLGGAYPRRPISSFYPLLSWNDNLNWQHGNHSVTAGAVWYREQDHYWNGPGGEPNYSFGITAQDPLGAVFSSALSSLSSTNLTNAEALYAELTGRVSSVAIAVGRPLDPSTKQYKPYGAYNLDEVQSSTGFWLQDRWRLRSNLTLNYGIRWDFVGDDHDVNGGYSTLPTLGDIWGPTPVGKIFSPGTLGGVANPQFVAQVHAYKSSYLNPSPAFALSWNPKFSGGLLSRLAGDGTVIRAGYSLRHYAEGAQNFWAFASNSGQFFFQSGNLTSNPTPAVGNFTPGSITPGPATQLPAYFLSPSTYSATVPAANLFPGTFYGMNPNLTQPYLEQWNFGIQRSIGKTSVFEARYVGNLALHQWLAYNINEVNIFENGFLNEFQHAQANLTINQANGKGASFVNNGLAGQFALPIFASAFGSATSNYTNGTYITNLQTGAAGSLANSLAANTTFFCNMVGTTAFPVCATKGSFPASGAYPVNFWQVNPYAAGRSVNYLDSAGMSNYEGLQLEFRQRPTYGAQFTVNYTWAHSLGISAQNGIQGQGNNIYYTDRNFRLNYGPGLFDIRHVVHASGTYDLPFGHGRRYLDHGGVLDRIIGGWTLGTILVIQSGNPVQIGNTNANDGYNTVNNNDAGVYFNGITAAQLQSAVGVYKTGSPWVYTLKPSLISASGTSVSSLAPATTPGVWGYRPILYGPHWFNDDLSLNKTFRINERVHGVFQAEFLNVTNHPTFNLANLSVRAMNFAQQPGAASGSMPSAARRIELRANIEF